MGGLLLLAIKLAITKLRRGRVTPEQLEQVRMRLLRLGLTNKMKILVSMSAHPDAPDAIAFSTLPRLPVVHRHCLLARSHVPSPSRSSTLPLSTLSLRSCATHATCSADYRRRYQITTKVPAIYSVRMPESVRRLFSTFQTPLDIGFDAFATQTLRCLGLGGFATTLLAFMVVPFVLALLVYRRYHYVRVRKRRQRDANETKSGTRTVEAKLLVRYEALLNAAPWLLLLGFLSFPVVSSKAFSAFSCESFDYGSRYLIADYSVGECRTARSDWRERATAFVLALSAIRTSCALD